MAALILNLSTRWRSVVSLTPATLPLMKESPVPIKYEPDPDVLEKS